MEDNSQLKVLPLQKPPAESNPEAEKEPGLVQRTPPPLKPKPRAVKSAEVQEACCILSSISGCN